MQCTALALLLKLCNTSWWHQVVTNGLCCLCWCLAAAWEGTLDDDEIQAVSAYVFDQATNDKW